MVSGAWREPRLTHKGAYYPVDDLIVEPKPARRPRPTIYAGGESEAAKTLIAAKCDAYVMHGDPVDRIAPKIADMRARRERAKEASDTAIAPLLLLQCSPQLEEMERFAETVMPLVE